MTAAREQFGDGLVIEPADKEEFGLYHSIYLLGRSNVWFPTTVERYRKMFASIAVPFWIRSGEDRVAMVSISDNRFGFTALIPPFSDERRIVQSLVSYVNARVNPDKPLIALSVQKDSYSHYRRLGFGFGTAEKCMIRPTDRFNVLWDEGLQVAVPVGGQLDEMVDLCTKAFAGVNVPSVASASGDYYRGNISQLFGDGPTAERQRENSTVLVDTATGEMVGLCTIEFWEELPCIQHVAVRPDWQGHGLGKRLLKKVLSDLHGHYPATRLWVQVGNSAETLYHNLGFLAGTEVCDMTLPAEHRPRA